MTSLLYCVGFVSILQNAHQMVKECISPFINIFILFFATHYLKLLKKKHKKTMKVCSQLKMWLSP